MFTSTKMILDAWGPSEEGKPEEFKLFIIYGPLGKGKSAYAIKTGVQVLQAIYGLNEEEVWEKIKEFVIFHPEQFFKKLEDMMMSGVRRYPFIIWDDAGLWLSAMDWTDPFLKTFSKYLNVVRTMFASFILTTPMPRYVLKSLRGLPDAMVVKIIDSGDYLHLWHRFADGYLNWFTPDGKKTGVRHIYRDPYNCKLPDDFYFWYKPYRDMYQKIAFRLLLEEWEKKKKQSKILQQLKEMMNYETVQT